MAGEVKGVRREEKERVVKIDWYRDKEVAMVVEGAGKRLKVVKYRVEVGEDGGWKVEKMEEWEIKEGIREVEEFKMVNEGAIILTKEENKPTIV